MALVLGSNTYTRDADDMRGSLLIVTADMLETV